MQMKSSVQNGYLEVPVYDFFFFFLLPTQVVRVKHRYRSHSYHCWLVPSALHSVCLKVQSANENRTCIAGLCFLHTDTTTLSVKQER